MASMSIIARKEHALIYSEYAANRIYTYTETAVKHINLFQNDILNQNMDFKSQNDVLKWGQATIFPQYFSVFR